MSSGYGGIVRVRYKEYIVGILLALISPYLRRLYLLEYLCAMRSTLSASPLHTAEELHADQDVELAAE